MKLFLSLLFFTSSVFFGTVNCPDPPELNRQVLQFVKQKLNKKVGRGECWDLAAEALNSSGAKWDNSYGFGKKVDPKKDSIFAGDIIQFDGVHIRYQKGKTIFEERLDHHTAVVFEVLDKGIFRIAEQNTSAHGRKVALGKLDLSSVIKGKYQFYRPVGS